MTDEQIKELQDMNDRLLFLLGCAASQMMDYKDFLAGNSDEYKKCKWFFEALDNIVYLKKSLPEMP